MSIRRVTLLMLIAVVAISLGCGLNSSPGTGEKIGQVVKLSRQGMLNATWEGQLIRGGMSGGSGTLGTAFDFTIEDDAMAQKAMEYMQNQTEVIIRYRMEGIYNLWRTESSGHFLTSIGPAKK